MDPRPIPSFDALTLTALCVKVVDVGANPIDGSPPYAAPLRAGNAKIVGFEPNPHALARLNEMKGPNEVYLPYAIGDGCRHTLHICQAPGMTSLLRPNPKMLDLFHGFSEWGRILATEEVETVRLDDVPETAGAEMIKLDIQGAELMALRNGQTRLREVLVIQSEVEFVPIYAGQPLFSEVDTFLMRQGFMFHRFLLEDSGVVRPMVFKGDRYTGMSQMMWADAIFVRDFTRLELLSNVQLLSMATILHDCYQSIDLVQYLLAEHDRRTGAQLRQAYLSGLQQQTTLLPA